MREIKFRGWHITQKKMYSAEEMAQDQLTLLPTGQFINVNGTSTKFSTIFPQDKFVPLQFTGLKDKNGKEIWEGDIVKHKPVFPELEGKIHIGEIKIEPSRGICVNNVPLSFEPEILGNIYENPELLTQEEGGKKNGKL